MAGSTDPYRELFERSADAILIIAGDTFVACNDATVTMLGYATRQEVLSTHPSELSPPTQPDGRDSFEKANEMMATAFERGSHRFEWEHRRADGEVFPVEVLLTAVQEGERRVLHVVWRDITERRRLEEELRHVHKMEAVGKLAGGIAHDFNNLLVVILGNAELLAECSRANPEFLEYTEAIQEAGQRAVVLVRELLAFGRKQDRHAEVLDVSVLVERIQRLLERLIGEDLELKTRLHDEPLLARVDPGHLEQVIMNLVSNARDASPGGGVLEIQTRLAEVTEGNGGGGDLPAPGAYAVIAVSDSGTGMAPETVERAFDPFFTTKEPGSGTGLGLSTVYGIVQQSGGSVRIRSSQGQGTTVEVFLPRTHESPVGESSAESQPAVAGGSEKILVVEDEPGVRRLIVSTLSAKGYGVLAAEDGVEGVHVFLGEAGKIDLIVSDVIMPRSSGPDMVRRLAELGHDPRVLFLSGYTRGALGPLHEMGQGVDLLEKPFSTSQLTERVRRALDGRSDGDLGA